MGIILRWGLALGHRIEGVGNGDDPRFKRNGLPTICRDTAATKCSWWWRMIGILSLKKSSPSTIFTPIIACSWIYSYSSEFRAPGFWSTSSLMPIFPISWRSAPYSRLSSRSSAKQSEKQVLNSSSSLVLSALECKGLWHRSPLREPSLNLNGPSSDTISLL